MNTRETISQLLDGYEAAMATLAAGHQSIAARKRAIACRDAYLKVAPSHVAALLMILEGRDEAQTPLLTPPDLLDALKAMVASYDGLRDALTCPTVIGKLAAADAAIAKAEGR